MLDLRQLFLPLGLVDWTVSTVELVPN
jgi:hypothetical protein